jgi:hypothetical protein
MSRLRVDHPDLVQAQMEFDHVKRKRAAELKVVPLIVHVLSESSPLLDFNFWNSFNNNDGTFVN